MPKFQSKYGLFAVLIFAAICRAQQLPDLSPFDGYTAGQSQQGGPAGSNVLSGLEIINPANGTLTLHIPLVTVQGRGNVSVPLSVNLTPPMWDVTGSTYIYNCNPGGCQIGWNYTMSASGWLSPVSFGAGQFAFRYSGDYCVAVSTTSTRWNSAITRGTFTAPDGTETEFVDQQTNGAPEPGNLGYNRGTVFITDNGSMAKFTASAAVTDSTDCISGLVGSPSGTLVFRDGTKYTITNGAVTQIEDHNGNLTSFGSTVTDSLGRTYQISSGTNTETITYKGAGGATRTIAVHYASLSSVLASGEAIQTYYQLWPGAPVQNSSQQFNPNNMVSEIDLADGSKYTFTYHSYGDVAQITLPTGGRLQYDYGTSANSTLTAQGTVYLYVNGNSVLTAVPSATMYARPSADRAPRVPQLLCR